MKHKRGYTFKPLSDAFRVLAWGRGIPSTTLAVMSARGELQHLDAVIHADAGWEHYGTQEKGTFYSQWLTQHGLYVEVLPTGDIRRDGLGGHIHMPLWTANGGPLQRQCSQHFKIAPQKRRMRELLGFHPSKSPAPPAEKIEQWIGFTMDEMQRMKPSRVQYIVNRFPLIEMRMTRRDCVKYLQELGLPLPPPSSCVGCPYKGAGRWLASTSDEMTEGIEFDRQNRDNPLIKYGVNNGHLYIYRGHDGPVALEDADLQGDAHAREQTQQAPLFDCSGGICGV